METPYPQTEEWMHVGDVIEITNLYLPIFDLSLTEIHAIKVVWPIDDFIGSYNKNLFTHYVDILSKNSL